MLGGRKMVGRRVWFKKVFWSYVPCSIEGWLILFFTILIVLGVNYLLQDIGKNLDFPLQLPLFAFAFVFLSIISAKFS